MAPRDRFGHGAAVVVDEAGPGGLHPAAEAAETPADAKVSKGLDLCVIPRLRNCVENDLPDSRRFPDGSGSVEKSCAHGASFPLVRLLSHTTRMAPEPGALRPKMGRSSSGARASTSAAAGGSNDGGWGLSPGHLIGIQDRFLRLEVYGMDDLIDRARSSRGSLGGTGPEAVSRPSF